MWLAPGHRCGLRSRAVRDRPTIEGLNDIFSIKCHRNHLYAGHARQFGKRMSSIPRHLNASPSPGALQGTSRGKALSGSPRAEVSSRGRARFYLQTNNSKQLLNAWKAHSSEKLVSSHLSIQSGPASTNADLRCGWKSYEIFSPFCSICAVRPVDCALAGQNAEIMRFVRQARLSPDKLLCQLSKLPRSTRFVRWNY